MIHKHTAKRGHSMILRIMAASVMVFASLGLAIAAGFATQSAFAQGGSPATECDTYAYFWKFDDFDESTGTYGSIEENAPDGVVLTLTPTNWKEEDGKKEALEFDWTSNVNISKMIVKAGNASNNNVYTFPSPGETSGHGTSLNNKGISHVTFCFDNAEPPTVVPEAPMAIIFPIVALIVAGGAWFVWRRQQLNAA